MVILKLRVVYKVELDDRLVEAVYKALTPEMSILPETCRGEVNISQRTLILIFECSSLSKVRALNNNLISLLALLLRIVGELENVGNSA